MTRRQFVRKVGAGAAVAGAAAIGLGRTARAAPAESWVPDTTIVGTGNPAVDVPAVQGAVDNPAYNKILLRGTFNFGDDVSGPRQTVVIQRGVELRGEVLTDPPGRITGWQTEIVGGGEPMPIFHFGIDFYGPNGAFKVANNDGEPVSLSRMQFRKWSATAIFVTACQGLEVRGCNFFDPDVGYMFGRPPGSPPNPDLDSLATMVIMTAILPIAPESTGSLVVEDNVSSVADSFPSDDEQFIACEFTKFSQLRIARNDVYSHDEGIAVMYNGWGTDSSFSSAMSIADNKVVIRWRPLRFYGSGGLLISGNQHATIDVSGNSVDLFGGTVALALCGSDMTVRNNRLAVQPSVEGGYPWAAIMLGTNIPPPANLPIGGPLNDSVISNNIISGTALLGFWAFDLNDPILFPGFPPLPDLDCHGNVVMGNNTDNLTTLYGVVWLTPKTHDNVFKGGFGSVVDLGTNNLITGYTPRTGGIGPEVSEAFKKLNSFWMPMPEY